MRDLAAAASMALASALVAVAAGCYATGERAQGAEGFPAVEYKPCCDPADEQLPKDGDWGLFCTKPAPSCYVTGERVQGAEGFPAVESKPCCDAADEQLPKDGDWGLFCTKPAPSCYATGERTQGAEGFPAVEYKPCCDPADEQLPKDGNWGLFCSKPAPSCYVTGERAQGAEGFPAVESKPCCDATDEQLPKDEDWGLFCTKPVANCYATGERAQGAEGYPEIEYKPCCDAVEELLPKDGEWGLFCTKPEKNCYATGERTAGAEGFPEIEYKPCCDVTEEQLPKDGDWGLFCTKPNADCYATGERTVGAEGYPEIEYKPCCDAKDEQLPKDGDWGLFCTKPMDGDDGEGGGEGVLPDGATCETGVKGETVSALCAEGLECSSGNIESELGICAPPEQEVTVNAEVETKCGNKVDGSGPTYTLCKLGLKCLNRGGGGLDQPQGDNLFCVNDIVELGGVCDIGLRGLAVYRRCVGAGTDSELSCYGGPSLSVKGLCVQDTSVELTAGDLGDKCGMKADGSGPTYVMCSPRWSCADRGGGGVDPVVGDNLFCIRDFVQKGEVCDTGLDGRAVIRKCRSDQFGNFKCDGEGEKGLCVDA